MLQVYGSADVIKLTAIQREILSYKVLDPDAWIAHAEKELGARAQYVLEEKVKRWRGEYERDSALLGYRTRAQRDLADAVPPTKAQLKSYAADRRWRKETGGVTLPSGVIVRTDDAAQRKVAELRRRAKAGEIPLPFGFKAETGWIDADLPAIEAIDQAIAAHVAGCYALERQIDGDIEAGAVTTTAQIDAAFAG